MTPLRQGRSHLFSFSKCLMTEVEFLPLAEGDNVMLNLELYSLRKVRKWC